MNVKCHHCGLVNWQTATECKRCQAPLTASAEPYEPGQWNSPYAPPPPPPQFYNDAPAAQWGELPGVWRKQSTLVMDKNAALPALCVKCGCPVERADFEK